MNSEECIVISDEEEETPTIVITNRNVESRDDCSTGVCMPEFVSVPSTSSANMESEIEINKNPAKVASTGHCNFLAISKSDLKRSIKKNDLIIKIDGTLNPSNVNAIMAVIKLYNFQNAGKFFFVKSSNPNEEIDINDLICHEKVLDTTSPNQENSIPQLSQKLNVICKSNKVKALTVANHKPHQTVTATTTRKDHEIRKRKIDQSDESDQNTPNKFIRVKPIEEIAKASCQNSETVKLNEFHQNKQNIYNRIRVKPFDQIGIKSHENVEAALGHVDNNNANQTQINVNKSNQNTQKNCSSTGEIPFDQMAKTSHQIIKTPFAHNDHDYLSQININESTQFHQNAQKDCYKIRLKPFSEISKPSHQVFQTAVSTDDAQCAIPPNGFNEFNERTRNDSSLREAQQLQIEKCPQETEHDPNMSLLKVSKNKCRSVNWNNNNNTSPTNLNVFSVNTQNNSDLQNDRINCELIQKDPLVSNSRLRLLNVSKADKRCVVKEKTKNKIKGKELKLRMKNNLKSFYEKKHKLKEVRIAVSRLEVENYFMRKKQKEKEILSVPKERPLPNVNQIFIDDHNFGSMTHYYCNKIPPNTQLYFVNKHNITTSLYMKSFPLFAKAIRTNKIKVISESTYKKYQPTAEDKLMSSSNSSVTQKEAQKFCKFVFDYHRSLSIKQNPFLKCIKLDHSYSVTMT